MDEIHRNPEHGNCEAMPLLQDAVSDPSAVEGLIASLADTGVVKAPVSHLRINCDRTPSFRQTPTRHRRHRNYSRLQSHLPALLYSGRAATHERTDDL